MYNININISNNKMAKKKYIKRKKNTKFKESKKKNLHKNNTKSGKKSKKTRNKIRGKSRVFHTNIKENLLILIMLKMVKLLEQQTKK